MRKRYNTPHRSRVVKTRMAEEEYRRVCGKAFCLQHKPSRVYPASHNRGSHTPHSNCFPVNDELLAAVGKLTAEYAGSAAT